MAKFSDLEIGTTVIINDDALGGRIEAQVVEINQKPNKTNKKFGKLVGLKLSRHCAVGHECDGVVDKGYGWWARPDELTVVES